MRNTQGGYSFIARNESSPTHPGYANGHHGALTEPSLSDHGDAPAWRHAPVACVYASRTHAFLSELGEPHSLSTHPRKGREGKGRGREGKSLVLSWSAGRVDSNSKRYLGNGASLRSVGFGGQR